jgi:hypothetical protein
MMDPETRLRDLLLELRKVEVGNDEADGGSSTPNITTFAGDIPSSGI